jgi:hypothetical protein
MNADRRVLISVARVPALPGAARATILTKSQRAIRTTPPTLPRFVVDGKGASSGVDPGPGAAAMGRPHRGHADDTEHGVNIDVLSTGRFPGDDKPKPIAFPDPATTAVRGERFALLPLARYIELKLASGMVAPHRAKDLVDIQELIRSAALPRDFVEQLDPWVRSQFLETWQLAQIPDPF